MSIVRVAERPRYLVMDKTAVEDRRLSWKARGLLAYLLSKPDDWQVRTPELIGASDPDGRTAVQSGLRELEDLGYIRRQRVKDERGRWSDWELLVYERPAQQTERRQAENLTVGEPGSDANDSNHPTDEPETRLTGYRRPTEAKRATDSPPPTGEDSPRAHARTSGGEETSSQELPPTVKALLVHPRLQAGDRCLDLTAKDAGLVEQLRKELERPGVTPARLAEALAAAARGTIAEASSPDKALAWRLGTDRVQQALAKAERTERERQDRLARQRADELEARDRLARRPAAPAPAAPRVDWERIGGLPSEQTRPPSSGPAATGQARRGKGLSDTEVRRRIAAEEAEARAALAARLQQEVGRAS